MPRDDGEEWYTGSERFDVVYAVGDTHGDVGATVAVFRDLLGVVRRDDRTGHWAWSRPRCAVVVLGDVVDRSRVRQTSEPGENDHQSRLPDDLFLLRLLNHWADLADRAQSLLIRLVGNHEVFQGSLRYSTARDQALLYGVERHPECRTDIHCNRQASFRKEGGAYFRAIWGGGHPRVVQQIGPWVFVHGGITERAVEYVRAVGPQNLVRHARAFMTGRCEATDGLGDLLETRTLDHRPGVGDRARALLDKWALATGRAADFVAVGHCLQRPDRLATWRDRDRTLVVHAVADRPRRTTTTTTRSSVYRTFGPPAADPGRPWINASLDAAGRPSVFRLDVGLSRCWSSTEGHVVRSQALAMFPREGFATATLFEPNPSLGPEERDAAAGPDVA